MIAMEELLSLKWNNHRSTFLHILAVLRDKQLYTDVTIACDGKFYNVHKLVLSTCSDYFSAMFDKTAGKVPIIVLKDIKSEDLEALLDYMYLGEVNVRQCDLSCLIKSAECLRIKGLAVPDDEPPKKHSSNSSNKESSKRTDIGNSPPSKRKKREEDGRDEVRLPDHPSSSHSSIKSQPISPSAQRKSSDPNRGHNRPPDNNTEHLDIPKIKEEVQDIIQDNDLQQESFDMNNEGFKEEIDDTGELSSDIPEFLEESSGSYSHSYPSTSFQPDMSGWQDDPNYSGMNYGSAPDGSQNAGVDAEDVKYTYISNIDLQAADSNSSKVYSDKKNNMPFVIVGGRQLKETNNELFINCPVCHKQFSGYYSKYNLQKHLGIHMKLKPFDCPICKKSFNQKISMQRHVAGIHKILPDAIPSLQQ